MRKKKKRQGSPSPTKEDLRLIEGEHSQSPLDINKNPRLRPASAAQVKSEFRKRQILNRPATAVGQQSPAKAARERDESFSALLNLQGMLKKVFEENGMLLVQKESAEKTLKEFMESERGHIAK